jgi:hypothetical protein
MANFRNPERFFQQKDWLTHYYVTEKMSSREIARLASAEGNYLVSGEVIMAWLKKHGIGPRTMHQAQQNRRKKEKEKQ